MEHENRFAEAKKSDPLFAEILDDKDGDGAPGYNPNDLVEPMALSNEGKQKLEEWGL